MTKHHARWEDIKAARGTHPEAQAAYERARRAHELGVKVRQLREERGLSQAELARRMGSTQSVIARLELGGVEPRFETIERVCRALDLELVVDFRPRTRAGTAA
jgi:ribosome-binding protein aMBF1 (putative translation factor)